MSGRTRNPSSVELPVAFAGRPLVVGITPDQPELVAQTAASLARALGVSLVFAFVDSSRYTERELPDGSVKHRAIDPDGADESWRATGEQIVGFLGRVLAEEPVDWSFRYLAGSPQRSLTHLARAVDASMIVVGTRRKRRAGGSAFFGGSVGVRLSHHQHRPVLVVPLDPVDWKAKAPWE